MKKIIFVHGMNGTAASWNTIPELFEKAGHEVAAPDLPGHDKNMTMFDLLLGGTGRYLSGVSMDDYVAAITATFPSEDDRNVVLVGHSMGGAIMSHVASRYPDRIFQSIYVAAMLPDEGDTIDGIVQEIREQNTPIARTLQDFLPHLDDMRIVRQPSEPLEKVFIRSPEFDAIHRSYVKCSEDDVIPVAIQNRMLARYSSVTPATEAITLGFSHFPQFDDPQTLFDELEACLRI